GGGDLARAHSRRPEKDGSGDAERDEERHRHWERFAPRGDGDGAKDDEGSAPALHGSRTAWGPEYSRTPRSKGGEGYAGLGSSTSIAPALSGAHGRGDRAPPRWDEPAHQEEDRSFGSGGRRPGALSDSSSAGTPSAERPFSERGVARAARG